MKRAIRIASLILIPLIFTNSALSEVTVSPLNYSEGATTLEGSIVRDSSTTTSRGVVLVFHDWMGPSEVTLSAAKRVAAMGYTALIADIFGKGVRPTNVQEASAQISIYKKDRVLMRKRANAAFVQAAKLKDQATGKIAAIGFCFGGTVALELARSGAALLGAVSFHGGLDTPDATLAKNIKGKILALHGADDPFVSPAEVTAFESEMRNAHVDWQLVQYGGAVHAFTNEKVDALNLEGAKYNANADRRSFEALAAFLKETL